MQAVEGIIPGDERLSFARLWRSRNGFAGGDEAEMSSESKHAEDWVALERVGNGERE
jgi:hypothetical protein